MAPSRCVGGVGRPLDIVGGVWSELLTDLSANMIVFSPRGIAKPWLLALRSAHLRQTLQPIDGLKSQSVFGIPGYPRHRLWGSSVAWTSAVGGEGALKTVTEWLWEFVF